MLTPDQLAYVNAQRVARLATADADGVPHVVPICHAASASSIYISNGAEETGREPKRVRNIARNARVSLVVDHYSEDWDRIGYVLVSGSAEVLRGGTEYATGARLLQDKYPQFRDRVFHRRSMIAIRVERVVSWGDLSSGM